MKKSIIAALIAVGFLAWLAQLFEPGNVFGRTLTIRPVVMTWDGKVSVVKRSDPAAVMR